MIPGLEIVKAHQQQRLAEQPTLVRIQGWTDPDSMPEVIGDRVHGYVGCLYIRDLCPWPIVGPFARKEEAIAALRRSVRDLYRRRAAGPAAAEDERREEAGLPAAGDNSDSDDDPDRKRRRRRGRST